jgi:hypothetical protein
MSVRIGLCLLIACYNINPNLGSHNVRSLQTVTVQHVYSIPRECGRSYIGETGRPLAVRLREYGHNLKEGLLEKSLSA